MGIRFRCHYCETELHVKDFQAGKRGRCPECKGKFRIPPSDAPHSLDPDEKQDSDDEAVKAAVPETKAVPKTVQTVDERPQEKLQPQAQVVTATSSTEDRGRQPQNPPPPRALQTSTDSKWYVRPPSGGQYGPATSVTMRQWLGENRVGRDALVWCEGWPEWLIAENVFDDYFATVVADSSPIVALAPEIPAQKSAPMPSPSAGTIPAVTSSVAHNPSISERNRLERKQKRRRNYTWMITLLTVIMLLLIATLVIVLLYQSS